MSSTELARTTLGTTLGWRVSYRICSRCTQVARRRAQLCSGLCRGARTLTTPFLAPAAGSAARVRVHACSLLRTPPSPSFSWIHHVCPAPTSWILQHPPYVLLILIHSPGTFSCHPLPSSILAHSFPISRCFGEASEQRIKPYQTVSNRILQGVFAIY